MPASRATLLPASSTLLALDVIAETGLLDAGDVDLLRTAWLTATRARNALVLVRGKPTDLLDAETNLKYGVKYLRGAYMVAGGNKDAAVKWYARGYYYEAKRKGLLEETGLR